MEREIILYTTKDGKYPVKDFLDSLPNKVFKKIAWVLQLIVELDRIPSIYFKKLENTNDIWECRVSFGSNICRLLCFFRNGSVIILTNGFQKKSQKTPINEIEKAEEYKTDYLRRFK
jgi:phage-related protein